ncbi:outer membrane beta-barrel protein [Pedobacter duraquae]|uniref:Outer membrane beta-barrel protein n=1 Tax=Pedobacter duraquae TaxID=425511 RepID=A0A4R6IHM5_9SPHI|nr:outer membrane beta-barrel protein [Pedobacter duraquae]TDO20685.1 outer membrane beta-barrel protein [Pedobacter duraquae]
MKQIFFIALCLSVTSYVHAQIIKKPDSVVKDSVVKQLEEVVVSGGTPAFSTKNGQLKIGIANNLFFKSSANLLEVFRKLPGLQVNADGTMVLGNRSVPTIFVDGKPVNLSIDEIQTYLSSLSPEMVESIEFITQPSSKYDGAYQAIIDVKLRQSQSLGLKGIYNFRYQQNRNSLFENNLGLNYKTQRFVYGLNVGQMYGKTFYKYRALQFLANSDAMTTDTRTITGNNNYNVQARVAYEPKIGQQIEGFFRTFQNDRNAVTNTELLTQDASMRNTLTAIGSENNAIPRQFNYAGGLNYDAQFRNSELHLLSSLAKISNLQNEDIQNKLIPSNMLRDYWKTNSQNIILIRSLQADYSRDVKSGKLELGGKYAFTTTRNDLQYQVLENAVFIPDPKRSNQFRYKEYISAGYISYSGTWEKLSYRASFRAEYTRSIANSITANTNTERTYMKWLPSANLMYALNDIEQLSFNYSKRLTRPTFDVLNPFRFYFSPRNYWIGNPYLQPSTTSLFALTYSRKSLNISLNAGKEKDPMARYPEYDKITDELAYLGTNLPYRNFADIQVNSPLTINKWWRVNTNLGLFYNRELRPYFDQTFRIPIVNYTITGSQVFTIKDWVLDVGYSYESKSGNGLYINAPVFMLDLGLQKAWIKNRLNSRINFYDVFAGGKRRFIFREKTIIDNDFTHYWGSNRLVFSLTYNFGTSTYKVREARKSEEEIRANR